MANDTLAYSAEVSVVKKWFDKWRAGMQLRVFTKTANKHYTGVLLKKTYYFLTSKPSPNTVYTSVRVLVTLVEYERHQAARKFFCSVQQSSLVACFVRWRAVMSTRRQLERMKRSIEVILLMVELLYVIHLCLSSNTCE